MLAALACSPSRPFPRRRRSRPVPPAAPDRRAAAAGFRPPRTHGPGTAAARPDTTTPAPSADGTAMSESRRASRPRRRTRRPRYAGDRPVAATISVEPSQPHRHISATASSASAEHSCNGYGQRGMARPAPAAPGRREHRRPALPSGSRPRRAPLPTPPRPRPSSLPSPAPLAAGADAAAAYSAGFFSASGMALLVAALLLAGPRLRRSFACFRPSAARWRSSSCSSGPARPSGLPGGGIRPGSSSTRHSKEIDVERSALAPGATVMALALTAGPAAAQSVPDRHRLCQRPPKRTDGGECAGAGPGDGNDPAPSATVSAPQTAEDSNGTAQAGPVQAQRAGAGPERWSERALGRVDRR